MPNKKPDTDIEFTVVSDKSEDGSEWYEAQLRIGGQVMGTLYTHNLDEATGYFSEYFKRTSLID